TARQTSRRALSMKVSGFHVRVYRESSSHQSKVESMSFAPAMGELLADAGTRPIRSQRFGTVSLGRPRDAELIHLVCQRCPLEAQASCRSTSASDNPIAFAERSQNLFSLGLLQCIAPAEAWVIQNFSQRYAQRWARGQQSGPFHKVLKFPDVARPAITREGVHRFVGNTLDLFSHAPSVLIGEVVNEKRNVITAISQRRDINRKHVQTIVKIPAEFLFGDHLGEVGIRGG